MKKHQVTKFQKQVRLLSLKKHLETRDALASEKRLQLIKVFTPPVINHLS